MRVGLRLGERSCAAMVLDGSHIVTISKVENFNDRAGALDVVLAGLRLAFGSRITDVVADVGPVLRTTKLAEVVAIRISPRPPADAFHTAILPKVVEPIVLKTVHVRGGHDMRARELARLDLQSFALELPAILTSGVRNVAITAVGSMATAEHEVRLADAILSEDSDMRVTISHDFYSNVFRDRDFTAILNSSLMSAGEELSALLETACGRHLPTATVSYAKNDGGRVPIRSLSVMPVHAIKPEPALRIQGAALLAGVSDGEVVVCADADADADADVTVGHTRRGISAANALIRRGFDASLASNSAAVERYTANHLARATTRSVVADLRSDRGSPLPYGLMATIATVDDIALVGCAAAPLTAWIDRLETASSAAELHQVRILAEEDARSVVVQLGASPGSAEILESNVFAMPYGNPDIVRIRVRAAGAAGHSEGGQFESQIRNAS
jgi:hypothetical protein